MQDLKTAQCCAHETCKSATKIKDLSLRMMAACTSSSYDQLASLSHLHLTTNFRATSEYSAPITSLADYLAVQRKWCDEHPDWKSEVVSATAEVSDNHANGTVYMCIETKGWNGKASEVVFPSVVVHKWRRGKEREWECFASYAMRSSEAVTDVGGWGRRD